MWVITRYHSILFPDTSGQPRARRPARTRLLLGCCGTTACSPAAGGGGLIGAQRGEKQKRRWCHCGATRGVWALYPPASTDPVSGCNLGLLHPFRHKRLRNKWNSECVRLERRQRARLFAVKEALQTAEPMNSRAPPSPTTLPSILRYNNRIVIHPIRCQSNAEASLWFLFLRYVPC